MRHGPLLVFALLTGCTQPAADNQAAPPAPATGNALAEIAKLNPRQLDMVLFRAIRDAGQECSDVTETKAVGQLEDRTNWFVTCRGKVPYLVAIGADGVANVTDGRRVKGMP